MSDLYKLLYIRLLKHNANNLVRYALLSLRISGLNCMLLNERDSFITRYSKDTR
jgi:hypothetical protein